MTKEKRGENRHSYYKKINCKNKYIPDLLLALSMSLSMEKRPSNARSKLLVLTKNVEFG